jgi:hypothetical protein
MKTLTAEEAMRIASAAGHDAARRNAERRNLKVWDAESWDAGALVASRVLHLLLPELAPQEGN